MLAMVATFRVAEDKKGPFEAVVGELAKQVLANEPGARLYQVTRSRTDPSVYKVIEIYEDEAALQAHIESDWLKAAGVGLAGLLEERMHIERLVCLPE